MILGLALGRVPFSVFVPITESRYTMFDFTIGCQELSALFRTFGRKLPGG
jgi:hypothetical protein